MTASPDQISCLCTHHRSLRTVLQLNSTATNHRGHRTRCTKVHGESRARRGLNPTALTGYDHEIVTLGSRAILLHNKEVEEKRP